MVDGYLPFYRILKGSEVLRFDKLYGTAFASHLREGSEMLVAIPVYKDEVAPRFGYASEVLLAEVAAGEITSSRRTAVSRRGGFGVYSLLVSEKPRTVICGGIHPYWQKRLEYEQITVLWGVIGLVQDALKSYAAGELKSNQFVCPGRRAGRGRGRARRGHSRNS